MLEQALNAATTITDGYFRVHALAGLAPHLNPDERPAVLEQALTAATAITTSSPAVGRWTNLAPLPADQQPDVLAQALSAVTAITNNSARVQALTGLAPHLTSYLLPQRWPPPPSSPTIATAPLATTEQRHWPGWHPT